MKRLTYVICACLLFVPATSMALGNVPDCAWGWNNGSGGADVTFNLCTEMLVRNEAGAFLVVQADQTQVYRTNVSFDPKDIQVELVSPDDGAHPVVLQHRTGHTWGVAFDPGNRVWNFQVRFKKDRSVIFCDVTRSAAYQDGEQVNAVVNKPEEMKTPGEKGKDVKAISFAGRRS